MGPSACVQECATRAGSWIMSGMLWSRDLQSGAEQILASLSILIWHFYMTVFDPDVYPMDKAWWNGKASADHLKHTRPEYYMEIVAKQQEAERLGKELQEAAMRISFGPGTPEEKTREIMRLQEAFQAKIKSLYGT